MVGLIKLELDSRHDLYSVLRSTIVAFMFSLKIVYQTLTLQMCFLHISLMFRNSLEQDLQWLYMLNTLFMSVGQVIVSLDSCSFEFVKKSLYKNPGIIIIIIIVVLICQET